jgi:hypothetical protein
MSQTCPQCSEPVQNPQHQFCTSCGLALRQPCPHCSQQLATPADPFVSCDTCKRDFWSCRSCGRLYHLDRTSCHNSYCPEKEKFWTTRFGSEEFFQHPHEWCKRGEKFESSDSPKPAWLGGATAAADVRWPNLHTQGLLLSVQESGVVELWAERGAPTHSVGSDFAETSVCLTRLDLGEDSPCPPFYWHNRFMIPGSQTLSVLEMSSSPSVGARIDLQQAGRPHLFGSLRDHLIVWGEKDFGAIARDGSYETIDTVLQGNPRFLLTDGEGTCLALSADPMKAFLFDVNDSPRKLQDPTFADSIEYAIYADRYILVSGNRLAYLEKSEFIVVELPALVVSSPLYDPTDNRLTLLLNDGTARSCSTTGEKFSFVCELAGTPSTSALRLGTRLFYGTEGRYLCCDEEAIRPRLGSAPMGALSYANGRLFGTCRDGSLYCFEL